MGKYQHFECIECEAVFNLKFDLDDDYYNVSYCPFCGAEMDEDQRDEIENETDLN
jgi:PHP family Zn ribbon phosphoesterase